MDTIENKDVETLHKPGDPNDLSNYQWDRDRENRHISSLLKNGNLNFVAYALYYTIEIDDVEPITC